MQIILLAVGKTTDKWIQTGLVEYEKRLKHYAKFSLQIIPDIKGGKRGGEEVKKLEGESILKQLGAGDILILLDEAGKQYGSEAFSNQLQKWMNASPKRLVFLIGGAFGFSDEVKAKADFMMSLSKMTFTHQMVRPFFTEQLYRAFTILRGEKYHNP